MATNRAYELFERYLANKLSIAELEELHALLNDPTQVEALRPLLNQTWQHLKEEELLTIKLEKDNHIYHGIVSQKQKRFSVWYPIAATIFLCLIAGLGLLYNISKKSTSFVTLQTERLADIQPNSDNPILILSDGKKMVLQKNKKAIIFQAKGKKYVYQDGSPLKKTITDVTPSKPSKLNTVITPIGSQYMVTIPDGTKVWLNASSTISFPAKFGNTRKVYLSGEAYFEIAQDKGKPFIVRTAKQEIAVLGTHFNVSAYENKPATTTLLTGKIRVKGIVKNDLSHIANQSFILAPKQQLTTSNEQNLLKKEADLITTMAWKEGLFIFNDESIKDIMMDLSRWYPIEVKFEDNLNDMHFTGNYSKNKGLLNLLKNIEMTGKVHFKIEQQPKSEKERRVIIVAN